MIPLKVESLYLVDITRPAIRRRMNGDAYNICFAIDTVDEPNEYLFNGFKTFTRIKLMEFVSLNNLYGDKVHTFRFRIGPFYEDDVKDEFEKLKNIAYSNWELLLHSKSNNTILQEWTYMFIKLFEMV